MAPDTTSTTEAQCPPPRVTYTETAAFAEARRVQGGAAITPEAALRLVTQLRNELAFQAAREIAREYRTKTTDPALAFQLLRVEVTSTYKDPEVSTEEGLDDAWQAMVDAGWNPEALLDGADEAYRLKAREVHGLAGAIRKRRWEYDGRIEHLLAALRHYTLGYDGDVAAAEGYHAVNAAYILDLLASLEHRMADEAESPSSFRRRTEAADIRTNLIAKLPENADSWWTTASLAEACFGLGKYADTIRILRAGRTISADTPHGTGWAPPPDWEIESTARQLANLARIQCRAQDQREPLKDSPQWLALEQGLGLNLAGVRSAFVGKIGLALSGGGFRASLYHIGVLARLAELDLLRYVEVLSCVSGGSIIGAHYYLELRQLLQTRRNDAITHEDYLELVARVERDFLAGVQTNIRMQLAGDRAAAWANLTDASFSQTRRLGELFEAQLFARVEDGTTAGTPRWLNDLSIEPCRPPDPARDPNRAFSPRSENWKLSAKVPILILNATTLNTGHPWQFTAAHMGEPPGGINPHVDANARLRRVRFFNGPEGYRQFRLGHAVAASAAVPGLFDPLPLPHLYEKPLLVRLADGGVYDNQGISGLLEQGCTFLIVSDASGQSPIAANPPGHRIGVAVTANDVLMARVRGLQYDVLQRRLAARTLRGVAFVHLMQDLEGGEINQRGWPTAETPRAATALTPSGVRRDIQERLARIRTDLDAFSDFEAYALMASGYRAIAHQFAQQTLQDVLGTVTTTYAWRFRPIETVLTDIDRPHGDYAALCALLANGQAVLGKIQGLHSRGYPAWRTAARLLGLAALLGAALYYWWLTAAVLGTVLLSAAAVIGVFLLARPFLPAAGADDVALRKSPLQRAFAAVAFGLSLIAGRGLEKDTARYLAFGALDGEAFLTNSRRRWPPV
jgi:predicted acylesterase/phospholipase RssA